MRRVTPVVDDSGADHSRHSRIAAPLSAVARRIVLHPSSAGVVMLLSAVAAHLFIAVFGPDADGFLFRGGVLREAFGQALLLAAPPIALYAGIRAALADRDDLLAYLSVAGGGFLTLLTATALLV